MGSFPVERTLMQHGCNGQDMPTGQNRDTRKTLLEKGANEEKRGPYTFSFSANMAWTLKLPGTCLYKPAGKQGNKKIKTGGP